MSDVGGEDIPLTFFPLDEVCADGSPAGYYTDYFDRKARRSNNGNDHQKHTVLFREGGGCFSTSTCNARKNVPSYFGTSQLPRQIHGSTILSSNPTENPTGLADNYRWIIPYCTQDLWLGNGSIDESGLVRSGSKIVQSFWDEWERTVVRTAADDGGDVGQLVVVGSSAGTVAVLNHVDRILQVVASASSINDTSLSTQLRIILDSPGFGEDLNNIEAARNIQAFADAHIDPDLHPLCLQNATDLDLLSNLPCCCSVNCFIRNDPSLSSWARGDVVVSESSISDINRDGDVADDQVMLILESSFDLVQILLESTVPPSGQVDFTPFYWDTGEIAGKSITRALETVQDVLRGSQSPRIRWAVTSTIGHPFLLDSYELFALAKCGFYGSYIDSSGAVAVACNPRGLTFSVPFFRELEIAIKVTDETWKLSTVQGTSIQTLISSIFSHDDDVSEFATGIREQEQEISSLFPIQNVVVSETCTGPNCTPLGSTRSNPAQSLIEIEDSFVPLPIGLQVTLAVVTFLIPMLSALMGFKKSSIRNPNKTKKPGAGRSDNDNDAEEPVANIAMSSDEDVFQRMKDPGEGQDVFVKGLNVTSTTAGQRIIQDVSINLKGSTFNGLLGLSGSGKSTLLSVLAQQVPTGLHISADSISKLSEIPTTLLRQSDIVDFEKMTPFDYLMSTAEIYGTSKENIEDVFRLVRPFFSVWKEKLAEGGQDEDVQEKVVLDPFNEVLVGRLSGGQRKMLAIAAALFNSPKLLLLDEPLSGLDSSSSENLCDFLRDIAKYKAMTILMIIHQPSNDILMKMDGVILMCKGRVILEEEVKNIGTDFTPAEHVHSLLKKGNDAKCPTPPKPLVGICQTFSEGTEINRSLDRRDLIGSIGSYLSDVNSMSMAVLVDIEKEHSSQETIEATRLMKYEHSISWNKIRLRQIQPLIKRMQLESGFGWIDLLVVQVSLALITAWLRADSGSPMQVYTATALCVIVPTIIFQPRLIIICSNFRAHTFELQDKRISSVAFHIATAIYAYGIPVAAIALGQMIGYGILGWEWNTILVQILFAVIYTLAVMQVGKTFVVVARGDYTKLTRGFVLFVFLSILFSGFFVNVNKVPDHLRWLVYLSPTFWGLSGAVLNQLQFNGNFGGDPCRSFASCIALDRNFLARLYGYTPMTTALLSMLVLLIWFCIFFVLEGVLLFRFSAATTKLNLSKKDAKIE